MTAEMAVHGESQPILVGLDHSPSGIAALRWAACQGRLQRRRLHIVHAWEPEPGEVASLSSGQHARMRETVVAACRKWIEEALRDTAACPDAEIEILEGPAGPILVELAHDALLLVLGTRKHAGHRRLTADSVSLYCLSYAPCPVVTVPGKAPDEDDDMTGR
jgi:nucleotide-binding universal stress UspA family protein